MGKTRHHDRKLGKGEGVNNCVVFITQFIRGDWHWDKFVPGKEFVARLIALISTQSGDQVARISEKETDKNTKKFKHWGEKPVNDSFKEELVLRSIPKRQQAKATTSSTKSATLGLRERINGNSFNRNLDNSCAQLTFQVQEHEQLLVNPSSREIIGTNVRGIEGSKNSCYMDSSLNSLFLFNDFFPKMLEIQPNAYESKNVSTEKKFETEMSFEKNQGENVRKILRENIAKPLNTYKALGLNKGTMSEFRLLLSAYKKSYSGDEMDPEEFISTLFGSILKTRGFYLIDGDDEGSYVFQTYADMTQPTHETDVQTLLEYSFKDSQIELASIPDPGFIIKMPVTDGNHMFEKIYPNPIINLKNFLKNGENRMMHLSAVICLSSHHYTSFVREGEDANSPSWWYLDSFSYQRAEQLLNFGSDVEKHSDKEQLMDFLYSTCYMCFYVPIPTSRFEETEPKLYTV